jgi:hypothetical protein
MNVEDNDDATVVVERSDEDRFATQIATFVREDARLPDGATTTLTEAPLEEPLLDMDFFFPQDHVEEADGDVVDTTISLIIDYGQMTKSSISGQIHEAQLWDVWMNEEIQTLCQGRLDTWLAILGITFEKESWSSQGEVTLKVRSSNLFLSCRLQGDDMVPL